MSDDTQEAAEILQAMQAGAAAGPVDDGLADPEPDEAGDEIVFVRNGWVRCTIAGKMHKLRRPFLGELRDLETSAEADVSDLQEMQKALKPENDADLVEAQRIQDAAKGLADDDHRKFELDQEATDLAVKAMERNRRVDKHAKDLRSQWWAQVFKMLTPPGGEPPEQLPTWVEDILLQQKLIAHWRSAPLAHGR